MRRFTLFLIILLVSEIAKKKCNITHTDHNSILLIAYNILIGYKNLEFLHFLTRLNYEEKVKDFLRYAQALTNHVCAYVTYSKSYILQIAILDFISASMFMNTPFQVAEYMKQS